MTKNITITTCLNKVKLGNIESNYKEITKLISKNNKSELLFFPLLSLTGYSCGELFNQKDFLLQAKEYLLRIVEVASTTTIISLPLIYQEKKYICNVVIKNKKILGVVPKICLNNYERKFFNDGKEIKNKKIEINEKVPFSFDLIFNVENANKSFSFNNLNSDIILFPSCDKTTLNLNVYLDSLYKDMSKHAQIIYLNTTSDTSTNYLAIPKVSLYKNETLLESKTFNKENISYSLNIKIENGHTSNLFIDEIINNQKSDFDINKVNSRFPFVEEYKDKLFDVISLQARALITRARNTNIFNMVLGVSGGLDSTLALIALYEARKLEPKIKIYGLTLPFKGNTSKRTKSNALDLLKLFKCDYIDEVDISKQVKLLLQDIKHEKEDVVYENAQARVRTLILMEIANKYQGMVIGTGDLSESALGWCTFNGDHMSMYNINSTLPKTLIKKVVEEYSLNSSKEIKEVLDSIINTPISPELTKSSNGQVGQKTEEQIGKYEINDFILYYFLKYKVDLTSLYNLLKNSFNNLSKEEIKKAMINFFSRFISQQFKRNCSPEEATISEFSLSSENYSLPSDIDNSFIINLIKKL